MSHYPPPPPPDQNHYNPVYPGVPNTQSILGPSNHGQYGDSVSSRPEPTVSSRDNNQIHYALTHELQQPIDRDDRPQQQPRPAAQMLAQAQVQAQTQHASLQSPSYLSQTPSQGISESEPSNKANRLRKACDSCSIRKVKCDESGPPCRACAGLDIPCTFSRPTKRRGPPNRHAAALKRQKIDELQTFSDSPSPASPTNAAQALAALSSHTSHSQLSAESICPLETLDLLINDFFTYIHPLCPFPHEPSFREAWRRREDLSNKSFLALLASMIGALVASFPRKPRLQLKAQRREKLFPNHVSLIHRCQHVCGLARGPAYLENEHISVYDAATSYFLALMGAYTFRWRQGRLFFGECLTILRVLNLHRPDQDSPSHRSYLLGDEHNAHQQPKDHITVQIGRRIFWTVFAGNKTLQQVGSMFPEIQVPPPTATDPYPPLPLEVDDFCIYPDHIDPQPPGLLSMIAGFNANIRAFSSYNSLSTMEVAWGIDHIVDWERQKRILQESLSKCRETLRLLPPELRVDALREPAGQSTSTSRSPFYNPAINRDPARSLLSLAGVHDDTLMNQTPEQRRHMQYEIQKANIYASTLATRFYIVQKYWILVEAHARLRTQQTPASRPASPHSPSVGIVAAGLDGILLPRPAPTSNFDTTEQEFRDERKAIVKDLLVVLSNIDQVNMEPNGESFLIKIRAIASTLLDAPDSGIGHTEQHAKQYLSAFLEILIRLERHRDGSEASSGEDEATELRDWTDLRDFQIKFAQEGGSSSV